MAPQALIWTDIDVCEAAMQEAQQLGHMSTEGCRLLETAQTYFARGRLFEGENGLWCHAKRERFETAQYRCLLWLSEAYEALGNLQQAETHLEALLHRDPLDEAALTRLLLLLHKQGMTAEALRRYKRAAALFASQGMSLVFSQEEIKRGAGSLRTVQPNEAHTSFFVPNGTLPSSATLSTGSVLLLGDTQHRRREQMLLSQHNGFGMGSTLRFPSNVIQSEQSLEPAALDCTVQCGMALAHMVTLIQQWYGMAMFSHNLQNHLDREIKKLDVLKAQYSSEAYTFSRRSMLFALAGLPVTFLLSRKQMHTLMLELEEFVPQCAASIMLLSRFEVENVPLSTSGGTGTRLVALSIVRTLLSRRAHFVIG